MKPSEFAALRRLANLTQEQAARRLGVTQRTIWRWEHAINGISELKAKAIREVMLALIFDPERRDDEKKGRWPHVKPYTLAS